MGWGRTSDDSGEDAVQTKTNEVTDALRRTTQLLQTELERSVLSSQMLGEEKQSPADRRRVDADPPLDDIAVRHVH